MRWLLAAAALLTMLVVTLLGGPALRTALADSNRPQGYLALGDSVAFGFNPLLPFNDANNFIGYPTPVAAALKEDLTNLGCPGETSGHLISLGAPDNGCQTYRTFEPLHVAYSTSIPQLQFADSFLQSHPQTLVISIDIGANDLFVLEHTCLGLPPCIEQGLPGMLATLAANLDTIYGHIRNGDAYHHQLVALTYYSLNYSDPLGTTIISEVNQVVADRTLAWGGVVADGFGAFAAAAAAFGGDSCAAGLLIVKPTSPPSCDVHPTPEGRDLLAQAIVNALRTD
jgi:lysophospholipase L1-like esterase